MFDNIFDTFFPLCWLINKEIIYFWINAFLLVTNAVLDEFGLKKIHETIYL